MCGGFFYSDEFTLELEPLREDLVFICGGFNNKWFGLSLSRVL